MRITVDAVCNSDLINAIKDRVLKADIEKWRVVEKEESTFLKYISGQCEYLIKARPNQKYNIVFFEVVNENGQVEDYIPEHRDVLKALSIILSKYFEKQCNNITIE